MSSESFEEGFSAKHHHHSHSKHHGHHSKHHASTAHPVVAEVHSELHTEALPETHPEAHLNTISAPQPVLPSIILNNGVANIDEVRFSRGIHVTKPDPGVLIEKSYNEAGNDRYGVGQYPNGQMRVFTADAYGPARLHMSYAKTPTDFEDVVTVSRDGLHLNNNTLFFDAENNNNTDPYYLQKVVVGNNQSYLRLTINDDNDESFQIWGNSCGEAGGCGGPGAMKHAFIANGDAIHKGNLTVQGSKINSMIDNRAEDNPPKWYRAKGVGEYTEFKGTPWAGIGGYSYVKTIVPWSDTSGGTVKQIAYSDDGVRIRKSSDLTDNSFTGWRWIGPM